jgi:hypothetical protein
MLEKVGLTQSFTFGNYRVAEMTRLVLTNIVLQLKIGGRKP